MVADPVWLCAGFLRLQISPDPHSIRSFLNQHFLPLIFGTFLLNWVVLLLPIILRAEGNERERVGKRGEERRRDTESTWPPHLSVTFIFLFYGISLPATSLWRILRGDLNTGSQTGWKDLSSGGELQAPTIHNINNIREMWHLRRQNFFSENIGSAHLNGACHVLGQIVFREVSFIKR